MTFRQLDQKYYVKKIIRRFGKLDVYEALKRFPHPQIPTIYNITKDQDEIIIIEEFINGISLDIYMKEHRLQDHEISSIFLQLCNVVAHLHAFHPPIIHRDIKPENILYLNQSIYLIDYDIARKFEENQTKDTTVIGSVGYAAPEQYGFQQSDTRSDIYAMGVLLNELITGEYPNAKLAKGPQSKIIQKSTALDPNNRYQTIEDMENDFCITMKIKSNSYGNTLFRKFAFPGLKSKSKKKRVLACIGYLTLFAFCFSTGLTTTTIRTPIDEMFFRGIVFLIILMMILVPCNYLNILSFTPLAKSRFRIVRFLNGYLIWLLFSFTIVFIYALLMSIIDTIL